MVGHNAGTIQNVTLNNLTTSIGKNNAGGVVGYNTGTIKNVTTNSLTVKGYDNVGGLVGYNTSNNIRDIVMSNSNVTGTNSQAGGLIGFNQGYVAGINLYSPTVTGKYLTGGLIGQNKNNTVVGANLFNINVTGTATTTGGILGWNNGGIIREMTVRGSVTGVDYTGGIVGDNQGSCDSGGYYCFTTGNIIGVISNTNVTGADSVGGLSGYTHSTYDSEFALIEGGIIKSTGYGGKAYGNTIPDYKAAYVSTSVTITKGKSYYSDGSSDGTSFNSSKNNDLAYYSTLKYSPYGGGSYTLIESKSTGDTNKTGYYFDYNGDGIIVAVPVGSTTSTPDPTPCSDTTCYPHDEELSISSGDNPPTCTIHYIVPVTNGIKVNFSCTDDNSVPKVRSEFNAVRPTAPKNFEYFTGIYKTGTVSGYTRNITATWDTNNSISIPSRSECYYYRYAAEDKDGNWSSYVTNDCYCGFDNSCK